jgi:hypothetical protein
MKKHIRRIEKHIGEINATLTTQSVLLGKQQVSIEHHIKRTDLLESEVRPIKKHVDMVSGALKLITAIGLGALIKALYG